MNKNILIVSDSSCDIASPGNELIKTVPLTISADGKEYIDNSNLNVGEMLSFLASYNGRSYTSCPTVSAWLEAFDGAKQIIAITMTSALSGTYNAACAARDMYLQEHPDANVFVIDTLSTGPEQRLMCEKTIELVNGGLSYGDIVEKLRRYLKRTRLFFSLASLHNFAQNGRVSKIVAQAVGILNMRIVATASNAGNIEVIAKCRGKQRAKSEILSKLSEAGFRGGKVRICHVEGEEFAREIEEEIKNLFPDCDVSVYEAGGLCSYYAERGGILIGCEC